MNELVSIIMPLNNCEQFVGHAIESVLNQTYPNFELIVVDDYSTDNSASIVESYVRKDSRVKLYKLEKNQGVSNARNIGIENAEGKYIAFLDSDDLYNEKKLELQVALMESSNYPITFSAYQKINEDGSVRGVILSNKDRINYRDLLKSNIMPTFSVMYNSSLIGKRYFDQSPKSEDYIYWLGILKDVPYAYNIKEILGYYRVRKNSRSSKKLETVMYQWIIYRNIEKLSLSDSLFFYLIYIFLGLKRYIT